MIKWGIPSDISRDGKLPSSTTHLTWLRMLETLSNRTLSSGLFNFSETCVF